MIGGIVSGVQTELLEIAGICHAPAARCDSPSQLWETLKFLGISLFMFAAEIR